MTRLKFLSLLSSIVALITIISVDGFPQDSGQQAPQGGGASQPAAGDTSQGGQQPPADANAPAGQQPPAAGGQSQPSDQNPTTQPPGGEPAAGAEPTTPATAGEPTTAAAPTTLASSAPSEPKAATTQGPNANIVQAPATPAKPLPPASPKPPFEVHFVPLGSLIFPQFFHG